MSKQQKVFRVEFAPQTFDVLADSDTAAREIAKQLREEAPYPSSSSIHIVTVTIPHV